MPKRSLLTATRQLDQIFRGQRQKRKDAIQTIPWWTNGPPQDTDTRFVQADNSTYLTLMVMSLPAPIRVARISFYAIAGTGTPDDVVGVAIYRLVRQEQNPEATDSGPPNSFKHQSTWDRLTPAKLRVSTGTLSTSSFSPVTLYLQRELLLNPYLAMYALCIRSSDATVQFGAIHLDAPAYNHNGVLTVGADNLGQLELPSVVTTQLQFVTSPRMLSISLFDRQAARVMEM
jgi:hypothetical protein